MNLFIKALALCVLFGTVAPHAASAADAEPRRLSVGVKQAPPFVIRDEDGSFRGVSIDLWRTLANDLGVSFDFVERDIEGLLTGVENGSIDIAVAALTVTAEREKRIDFTHPFHSSGLGIAASHTREFGGVFGRLLSLQFLVALGALVVVMVLAGALVWIFERRANAQQFGGSTSSGLGSGFWWAAVTMTTVGYGDKAPVTFGGRLVGLVWMFTSVITISAFTAAIASSLTLSHIEGRVRGPEDLSGVRTATSRGSTSERYLSRRGIAHRGYDDVPSALADLAGGNLDAVVYDAPILKYTVRQEFPEDLYVLPLTFERQDYAFAVRNGSSLREEVNEALLTRITEDAWQNTLDRYLGG